MILCVRCLPARMLDSLIARSFKLLFVCARYDGVLVFVCLAGRACLCVRVVAWVGCVLVWVFGCVCMFGCALCVCLFASVFVCLMVRMT